MSDQALRNLNVLLEMALTVGNVAPVVLKLQVPSLGFILSESCIHLLGFDVVFFYFCLKLLFLFKAQILSNVVPSHHVALAKPAIFNMFGLVDV
jgi:hypothetical protein